MQVMEIISASGSIRSVVNKGSYKITSSGTVIKLAIPKNEISGTKKVKNDLVLMKTNGEKILLEDFFATKEKNKLVVEEQGKLWLADYDAENFTGLGFSPVASMDEVLAGDSSVNPAVWLVPLIGVAAVGAGVAIYNASKSGGGKSTRSNSGEKKLESVQKTLEAKSTDLDAAQKQLADAMQAMKNNPNAATLEAVNKANSELQKAADALKVANENLTAAITDAKAQGVDTAAAEQVANQAGKNLTDASTAIKEASGLSDAAKALVDLNPGALQAALANIDTANKALEEVKRLPTEENLASVAPQYEQATKSLAEMQQFISNLQQAISNAQQQGLNVQQYEALLNDLQGQYSQASKALADAMAEAQQNLQDVAAAQEASQAAREALTVAEQEKASAKEQLENALALKKQVLEGNQLARVDEVNKAIAEANKALESAQQKADEANILVQAARDAADKISPVVDASVKPAAVSPVDMSDLNAIEKGLQSDVPKNWMEAVEDYASSFMKTIEDLFQQVMDSKPVEIIISAFDDVMGGIGSIADLICGALDSVVGTIGIIISAVVDYVGEIGTYICTLLNGAVDLVFEAIGCVTSFVGDLVGAVVDGISQGIADAMADVSVFDLVNPMTWVNVVVGAISKSIGHVIKNVADVILEAPGKIVDFIWDKIVCTYDATVDMLFNKFDIVKDAICDSISSLFDAFIVQPLDKLVMPIVGIIVELLSDPVGIISESAQDVMAIINTIIALPGEFLECTGNLISDFWNSFGGDKVIDGDGSELLASLQNISALSADGDISSLLKASDATGDINLDKLIPATAEENTILVENVMKFSAEVFHMSAPVDDSHTSAIPVAA